MNIRRVLVTGAAGAAARALLPSVSAGASHVALIDAEPAELARTAAWLRETTAGGSTVPFVAEFPADLSRGAEVDRVTKEVLGFAGMFDVLVHAPSQAGGESGGPLSRPESIVQSQLVAPIALTSAVLPGMRTIAGGSVVLIGPAPGDPRLDRTESAVAAAVRGGLAGYVRALSTGDGARSGPRVNLVLAGASADRDVVPGSDVGAEDVAAAVAFLLSPEGRRFDGVVLPVEAGRPQP